jgi:trk system potassium uptake protein TrkH
LSRLRNQNYVNIFNRRIPEKVLSKTISIAFFSIVMITVFTFALLSSELGEISHQKSRGMFLEILLEVVSAFGTVGLSTGITPNLSMFGKLLITILMFIGRLGPLTLALAIGAKEPVKYKYPSENLIVG